MRTQSTIIENYDRNSTISAFRYLDTTTSSASSEINFEIRRNNDFNYEMLYRKEYIKNYRQVDGKLIYSEDEKIDILKELSEDDIQTIIKFIAYDKMAMNIFNDYLKEYRKTKNQVIEDKKEYEPERISIVNLIEKEQTINNPFNGIVKNFYYKQSKKGKFISITTDSVPESIYICTYKQDDEYLVKETEMRKKISEEEIECIKSFIEGNLEAVNIFEEYLSKNQTKTR